jgi:hypothetical protein
MQGPTESESAFDYAANASSIRTSGNMHPEGIRRPEKLIVDFSEFRPAGLVPILRVPCFAGGANSDVDRFRATVGPTTQQTPTRIRSMKG